MVQNSLERITSLSNQDLGIIASRAGVEISRLKRLDEKELDVKYEHIKELGNLIQNSLIYISFQHPSENKTIKQRGVSIDYDDKYMLSETFKDYPRKLEGEEIYKELALISLDLQNPEHISAERANELINFCISLSSAYRLIKSPHPQGCFQ